MNIKVVAAKAGVSVATVSRVMSGSPKVRKETVELVQRTIDALGYVPNASAATLKMGHSRLFGLILPNFTNPYSLEFLREFEDLLDDRQHGVLLVSTERPERIQNSVRRMLTSQVEGLIILVAHEEFDAYYDRLAFKKIPTVTVDRHASGNLVSDVSFDFASGMREAVSHLHALGHRDIAFIGGISVLQTSRKRKTAFLAALRKYGLTTPSHWLLEGDFLVDSGKACMEEMLRNTKRPTAVIAANDMMALGALQAAHSFGLQVPNDLSIIGLDDILLARIVRPSLTTIRLPRAEAALACMRAFQAMAERPEGSNVVLKTHLVIRESTSNAPQ